MIGSDKVHYATRWRGSKGLCEVSNIHERRGERLDRRGVGGKMFFWIKLLACVVEREQERCERQAWVGEEKRKTRKRGKGGRGSNIRIHESVLFVGYRMKGADALLPVRSLA